MNLLLAATAVLVLGIGWRLLARLIDTGAQGYRDEAERLAQISSLSLPEAAEKALPMLLDNRLFRLIERANAEQAQLKALAPELRGFLGRYERVDLIKAPFASVSRSLVTASVMYPGYLRIGYVEAGTDVEGEVAVRPGREDVYELHEGELPDPVHGTHKSIYHWLLAVANEGNQAVGQ